MTEGMEWSDYYRPLLVQLYFKKPVGVKAIFSRPMVELAMELHISPKILHRKLFEMRRSDMPSVKLMWERYTQSPKQLKRDVRLLRQMNGFGTSGAFFSGITETPRFEMMFKPVADDSAVCPVMLVSILNLYFQLTPLTMVRETPEINDLASLLHIAADTIVEVMNVFQTFDPYMRKPAMEPAPLVNACEKVWQQYGNDPEALSSEAAQLADYWKK